MKKKFRLPRKLKKKLKKDLWFYPMDPTARTYLVAWPTQIEEDWKALKAGIVTGIKSEIRIKTNEDQDQGTV
jgi:hypothetical protein